MVNFFNSFCAKSEERDEAGRPFVLPLDGNCPLCEVYVLWGDLIRKKKGCYKDATANNDNINNDDQVI